MVTCSFSDTRVGYWEPAKWVAKLREKSAKDSGQLIMITSFDSGHFGAGGRLGRVREASREYAWLHAVMSLPIK
jgi:oligopeptidase B